MSANEDDARQIRRLVDSWIAASKAHDLPALTDMMTDDVVFMTPGRAPFGKTEFAADVERTKGVAIDARAEVQEIEVFGPWAYIRNHVRVEITSTDQTPKRMSGYAMSVLRKEADGQWRIARDANLVMPEQARVPGKDRATEEIMIDERAPVERGRFLFRQDPGRVRPDA